jgi:hypothetical protein
LSAVIPVAVLVLAAALLLVVRRPRDPKQIVHSLSISDRHFLADELERITRLPLDTAADEDAWYAATEETQQRLRARFSDVASVVPHRLYHYFTDADNHRKEPSYRAAQEAPILAFIRQLREEPTNAQPEKPNQAMERTADRRTLHF